MVEVRGDGNCQFRAVSMKLFGNENRHEEIRHKAVAAAHKAWQSEQNTSETFEQWSTKMSTLGCHGTEATIVGICNAYNCNIVVYSDSGYVRAYGAGNDETGTPISQRPTVHIVREFLRVDKNGDDVAHYYATKPIDKSKPDLAFTELEKATKEYCKIWYEQRLAKSPQATPYIEARSHVAFDEQNAQLTAEYNGLMKAKHDNQQMIEDVINSKLQSRSQPQFQSQAQVQHQPQPQPQVRPLSQSRVQAQTQAKAKAQAQPQGQPQAQLQAQGQTPGQPLLQPQSHGSESQSHAKQANKPVKPRDKETPTSPTQTNVSMLKKSTS